MAGSPAATRMGRVTLTVVTVVLGLIFGSGVAHGLTPGELRSVTDDYLFSNSPSQFTQIRDQRPYLDQLDWGSDGCTLSPDTPFGFAFLTACHRHDFGYRNYQRQDRFNEATRLSLDDLFRADMYSVCGWNWLCRRTADTYYWAVRQFGGLVTGTAQAIDRARQQLHRYALDALHRIR
jgi:hypothetical protein